MTDEEKEIEEKAKVKASEMLDKYKDATRLAEELADARNETFKLREKNRELAKTQTPEGATVLSGDDAAKWKAFGELGTPEDVTKRLKDAEGATGELSAMKREKVMREACEVAGIDYADFSTRKGVDDWQYEIKDEKRDGKDVKVPYVTVLDGDKDTVKPLAEHAKAAFPTIAGTQAKPNGTQAPVMGVNDGKVLNRYDAIRAEVQNKNKNEQTAESRDLKTAGIM